MINLRPALKYIGRRGAFLAFLAEIDILLYQSLHAALPFGLRPAQVYAPFLRYAPLSVWAAFWLFTGLTCAAAIAWLPLRPWAFMLAAALKTAWGLTYLDAWATGTLPRGYMQAAVWLTFAGVILIVSGWREGGRR